MPLDEFLSLHAMPIRVFFFNLNSYLTNTSFALFMPRITAVDECDRQLFESAQNFTDVTHSSLILSSMYDV